MAETKKVQLKDLLGNELLPQTSSDLVKTSDGTLTTSLGKMITQITINGETVNVVSGKAAITLPTASEYSIQKAEIADEGFASTYTLTKDGVQVGSKINIPKDMVVQSGSVKTVTAADTPVAGYKVGDKYIDLVLANAENSHIYVLVSDLVDSYAAGNGIVITDNQISIDTTKVALKADVDTALENKADKATTLAGYGITDGITFTEIL